LKNKQVDDLEETDRVHQEQNDEPDWLIIAASAPKGKTLPDQLPQYYEG